MSCSLFSQYTEVINSNRPGVSVSAFSVGKNVLQFETGPYMVKEKHTLLKYDVSGFGVDFAVRYGLFFEKLEIGVNGTYQNDTYTNKLSTFFTEEFNRSNFKNFTIGAKYLVYDPYDPEKEKPDIRSMKANRSFKLRWLIPAVSVYAGANFDAKDNPYTAPDVEGFSPKILVATQNNFPGGWVFVMNFIKDRIGSEFSDFQYLVTLTHSFNPQWVVFIETHGIKSDFYSDNLFRIGGAHLLTDNFQLDTALTVNTKDTPSVFNINLGVSLRLDYHKEESQQSEKPPNKGVKKKKKKRDSGKTKRKKNIDFND